MDQVVQYYVSDGQFMGAVLVARGDKVLLNKGYGSANLEWGVPNDPSTKFRIASLTKQFTAAATLLLVERGELKISDPIKAYLPDAPSTWQKITLFNLLTHTSGIPEYMDIPGHELLDPFVATREELVARFRDKPLDFEPGTKWAYSNSNYVLLGYMIERASGQKYAQFLQENIFRPLGMAESGYDSSAEVLPHRATGYQLTASGIQNAKWFEMSNGDAAGALYSTTEDLLRWQRGLFGGKVLTSASLQTMIAPFLNDYAFGLYVHTNGGRTLINHSGGNPGFNSYLAYYPDNRISVIVLGNQHSRAPDRMGAYLGTLAEGGTVQLPSERTEIEVPIEVLQRYVGKYRLKDGWEFKVTVDGKQIFVQGINQKKVPIFPESETTYFRKGADVVFEFVCESNGTVTGVILHQDGDFPGVRE
jgi:CubicO group peptidase (beta-lactamase class C family)